MAVLLGYKSYLLSTSLTKVSDQLACSHYRWDFVSISIRLVRSIHATRHRHLERQPNPSRIGNLCMELAPEGRSFSASTFLDLHHTVVGSAARLHSHSTYYSCWTISESFDLAMDFIYERHQISCFRLLHKLS